jgi:peptidoglycan L-alanyl-D-glutamate endopeptidase CwlK
MSTFKFSDRSLKRIEECHPDLRAIAHELIKEMDVVVLCGHRGQEEQEKAVHDGRSKLHFPHSKHNSLPSRAIDMAPYPIDWNDISKFNDMCDRISVIAQRLGIHIRQGRTFSFRDYPHTELA